MVLGRRWSARLPGRRSAAAVARAALFHLLGQAAPAISRTGDAPVNLVAEEGEESGNAGSAAADEAVVLGVVLRRRRRRSLRRRRRRFCGRRSGRRGRW